jgi:hypothetical protein
MTNTTPQAASTANSADNANNGDLLSNVRGQMTDRIEELAPAVEESNMLTAALAALDGNTATAPSRRRGRRPRTS